MILFDWLQTNSESLDEFSCFFFQAIESWVWLREMDRISGLPDELLVKIISFVPTKVAVSTSILSKRWESLWKWVPKLECDCTEPALRDFILKNLPLQARIIESLYLRFRRESFLFQDIKLWGGIAISHCLRELRIDFFSHYANPYVILPRSLYTCKSLVTLKLLGLGIRVDVPRDVCLPSLKTLLLQCVAYSEEDPLRLLLSCCPVLEDLVIELDDANQNVKALVVIVPTLQCLSLKIPASCSDERYLIVTPSLKYFKVEDDREIFNALIENMPELEEADIYVTQHIETLLESVTSVKRLTLRQLYNSIDEVICFCLSTLSSQSSVTTYDTVTCDLCSISVVLVLSSNSLNNWSYPYAVIIGQS